MDSCTAKKPYMSLVLVPTKHENPCAKSTGVLRCGWYVDKPDRASPKRNYGKGPKLGQYVDLPRGTPRKLLPHEGDAMDTIL